MISILEGGKKKKKKESKNKKVLYLLEPSQPLARW
jgi:hypothetical protein